ncbi:MAG: DNA polymerase III subunit gamma/tau [Caldilineaceae bacterium]
MAQALYRKWRSQTFDEVVGQEHVMQTLRNALRDNRVAHAYLFCGPRGTGKTSLARILAKALNCTAPEAERPCNKCPTCVAITEGRMLDLIEIDAASNNSVDDIRDLRDKVGFRPSEGRYKIYIIDECFRYEDLVTLADGSKIPIGKIVERQLPVEVLSYNETTHRVEPKPIVRYMRKPPSVPMLRITFDNRRTVVCTINHKFYTPNGQCCAGHLEVGQFVYANYERPTRQQLEVVAGAAIGDGHIALTGSQMRARLSITQGIAQKSYLDYKKQLLGNLVKQEPIFQLIPASFSKNGTYRLATTSYPQIAELHRELYDQNGRKKITSNYLKRIDALGLALWYLDDGSLVTDPHYYTRKKDGTVTQYPTRRSTLSVYGFTKEETQFILDWLYEKWTITGGFSQTAKGPAIWLTLDGTAKLHEIIAPYVLPEMEYKLLPAYRGRFSPPSDDQQHCDLAVSIVRKIEWAESPDYVYNIEVADNHNYFVRDILVANCHMLSVSAFNALLKTLEEPPPHARFVLATTEPHKLPATIVSRCQRFDFRRIPVTEIAAHLQHIVTVEQFKAEPEALTAIARSAQGCMRDAISLLDQMLSYGNETISFAQVQQALGAVSAQAVTGLVDALATKNVTAGLALIQQLVIEGASLTEFCHQVVEHLRGVMVIQMTGDASLLNELPADTVKQMQLQAKQLSNPATFTAIKRFSATIQELKGGYHPQLPLEMALIESIQGEALQAQTVIVQQIVQPAQTVVASPPPVVAPVVAAPNPQPTPAPIAAAAPKPEEPQASPEPPPLDSAAIQKLNARWKEFLNVIRVQCGVQMQAHLKNVKDIAISQNAVAFAFGSYTFSRDTVARQDTLPKVVEILSHFLGRPITLECQMGDFAKLTRMIAVTSSDQEGDRPDPLVEYAVTDLGAEVQSSI